MELPRLVLPANIVSIKSTKGIHQNAGDCVEVQTYRLVCMVHEGAVIEEHIACAGIFAFSAASCGGSRHMALAQSIYFLLSRLAQRQECFASQTDNSRHVAALYPRSYDACPEQWHLAEVHHLIFSSLNAIHWEASDHKSNSESVMSQPHSVLHFG